MIHKIEYKGYTISIDFPNDVEESNEIYVSIHKGEEYITGHYFDSEKQVEDPEYWLNTALKGAEKIINKKVEVAEFNARNK